MIHVLIQGDDANDVRPSGHPPVELHLSSGFGAIVKNLGTQSEDDFCLSVNKPH